MTGAATEGTATTLPGSSGRKFEAPDRTGSAGCPRAARGCRGARQRRQRAGNGHSLGVVEPDPGSFALDDVGEGGQCGFSGGISAAAHGGALASEARHADGEAPRAVLGPAGHLRAAMSELFAGRIAAGTPSVDATLVKVVAHDRRRANVARLGRGRVVRPGDRAASPRQACRCAGWRPAGRRSVPRARSSSRQALATPSGGVQPSMCEAVLSHFRAGKAAALVSVPRGTDRQPRPTRPARGRAPVRGAIFQSGWLAGAVMLDEHGFLVTVSDIGGL